MSKQILEILKGKLDEISEYDNLDAETRRNALKEELQFYVLNFIYHHFDYSKWIMYGGSALRIIHGLDRMSVDLDFEVSFKIDEDFLKEFKEEIENYFSTNYSTEPDFLKIKIVNGRGLLLKFFVGDELDFGHSSKQVHVKIDLNHFVAPKTVTEHRPINHSQLSFVILTYNMSALMASKIVAVFLRGTRAVGKMIYEEKGRDIYDLLWYMNKKIVPDFDYMIAKNVEVGDPRVLFDKLTLQMNKVDNKNLKNDLTPLFTNQSYIESWLANWLESYMRLLEKYEINTIAGLEKIVIHQNFNTDNFSFTYWYKTEEGGSVRVVYNITDYWIDFRDGDLTIEIDKKIDDKIDFASNGWSSRPTPKDKLKQYATFFYKKQKLILKR